MRINEQKRAIAAKAEPQRMLAPGVPEKLPGQNGFVLLETAPTVLDLFFISLYTPRRAHEQNADNQRRIIAECWEEARVLVKSRAK